MPTLLDLPTEILDIILNMLSHKFELVDTSYRLLYCLLFKEQTSAYALKNLYQDPAKFYLEKDRIVNLFSTLLASIRGCTTIPYHHSVEKFTDRTWRLYLSREIDAFGWMPEISTKLLQTGQLRELILSFPRDFVLKDKSTTFDVSMLKRLTVKSWSIEAGNITKEWMETLLPKMRLESLEILAGWTRLVCNVSHRARRRFPGDEEVLGYLLASQSETLRKIHLVGGCYMVPHKVSFPLLERIEIQYAALDKWKNIFGSLTSLKHVVLKAVRIYPAVTPFPLSASEQLETLDLTESPDMEERVADWLDENCTSLPGLRKLIVGTISVEALLSMLSNCPKLVKLGVIPEQEVHMPSDMTDEHLEAISRLAPPSFQTLSLHWVNYSKLGLDAFIASCPASITSLDISRSTGLTPTQLRALFRISTLRELFLKCVAVLPEHWKEINAIAANEKPEGLILHVDFDMPENEDDDI